jgi:hypothetical protein
MKSFSLAALALLMAASLALPAAAQSRSEADRALWREAQRVCKSWMYMPDGAKIYINYKAGWFRCDPSSDRKRDKRKSRN